jgi:hypothetical protein
MPREGRQGRNPNLARGLTRPGDHAKKSVVAFTRYRPWPSVADTK